MTESAPPEPNDIEYRPPPGYYDETLSADGSLRSAWKPLHRSIAALGLDRLTEKWAEARQIIRENGVTYNVYGDPDGLARPWKLDPIPHLIGPTDAALLEAGLIQRARLLNAVLLDLYGPQELLRRNALPPELILGNPGFLRACHGVAIPGQRPLHLYAADIGRTPDGRLWVLNDRTQAPSGAGYALENRIVLSRILPEAFRECKVQRLALFFQGLRESLRASAPHNRDNPRIVLLTPGPLNETYFEHAYLARYLGYALVEGSDLTVRDNRVYLRVLGGLQLVDCIVRRLDDEYCDPLELRADSCLGVPGLVRAVRAGHVTIANALGSGVVETPALMPFLPGICRMLLGEELKLPSIATWWCGQPEAREYVLGNLENLVVKALLPGRVEPPQFGDSLRAEERAALAELIRANPAGFVAQEILPLSTAPILVDHRIEPRHIVLRTYLAGAGDSYAMMPGGLTRVTPAADSLVVSMQAGGGSKDTWFLSEGPVSNFSLLGSSTRPVELSRGGSDLPSRAADNLFWLGRYAERADGKARLLRGILTRLTERDGGGDGTELPILLRVLNTPSIANAGTNRPIKPAGERELRREIFDFDEPNSLASILRSARLAAGTIRDRISNDMARLLAGLDDLSDPKGGPGEVLAEVRRPISALAAFGGLAMESMTRGQGWRFLDMGRRIERSLHAMRLMHGTLAAVVPSEAGVLEAALEISDSLMTYRRRYLSSLQPAPVIDLLLADESNPRSVAYQFAALAEDVAALPRDANLPGRTPEERLMLTGANDLKQAEIESLAAVDAAGRRPELAKLLGALEGTLWKLSDAITRQYLIHLQPSRHLAAGPDDAPEERPTP